ncbi:carboxypeptidase-like regulatory domain-containing protein [Alkalihalophilus sp. As8PL]|uniref:Carboxypeptidase-like regulatory domain-containing protein n=1 Tax=Alkalihalophilus sp. As8PL TaxID=3237103 RepID=A0AB39BQT0_9BACI
MKRKNFLYGVVGMLAFSLCYVYLLAPIVEERKVERAFSQGEPNANELIINLIDRANTDSQKLHYIEKYMLMYSFCCPIKDVYLSPSMSHWQEEQSWHGFTLEEMVPYLEMYVERRGNVDGVHYQEAVVLLTDYYAFHTSILEATEYVEAKRDDFIDRSTMIHMPRELTMKLVELYIDGEQYTKAWSLIEEYEQEQLHLEEDEEWKVIQDGELLEWKVELLIQEQKVEDAISRITDWQKRVQSPEDGGSYDIEERLASMLEQLKKIDASFSYGTVSGVIANENGEPIIGAEVYLRTEQQSSHSIHPESEKYRAITDHNGFYQFDHVVPDSYQLGVGLDFEQIDGYSWPVAIDERIKVSSGEEVDYDVTLVQLLEVNHPVNDHVFTGNEMEFSWKEDRTAASYQLAVTTYFDGGSITHIVKEGIEQPEVEISIEDLYHSAFYVSFAEPKERYSSMLHPEQQLSYAHSEGRFSWYVISVDEKGKEIRRSTGYRLNEELAQDIPFFQMKQRTLTSADQLLLRKKVDQALSSYQHDIEQREGIEQEHALIMATKLLEHKKEREGDDNGEIRRVMRGYIEQLYELTGREEYEVMLSEKG